MSKDNERPQFDLSTPGETPGERRDITINGVVFFFRWCPPGTFMMGEVPSDEFVATSNDSYTKDATIAALTQHEVTLTHGFWMLQTPVLQNQWQAIMGTNPSRFKEKEKALPDEKDSKDDKSKKQKSRNGNGYELPVENVSWNDCQDFCKKCLDFGLSVQLPTEAQWEYACRAGSDGPFSEELSKIAWSISHKDSYGPNRYRTSVVWNRNRKREPNEWRLYDMNGNVWEWCQDYFGAYPSHSVKDPTGPSEPSGPSDTSKSKNRVIRGGCFSIICDFCRSTYRRDRKPETRCCNLGFRVVGVVKDNN